MPLFRVMYYIVKPPPFPVEGSSGALTFTFTNSPAESESRARVYSQFREILSDLISRSTQYIPDQHSRDVDVEVIQVPDANGSPNFAAITPAPQMHDAIVYLVNRSTGGDSPSENPANPLDRRPSLVMLRALDNNYQEFQGTDFNSWRRSISSGDDQLGLATTIHDYAPMCSEVFTNPSMAWAATNWEEIIANYLAKGAFHEIAHCKAECQNRASSARWRGSISGSIHDFQSGGTSVAVCQPRVAWEDDASEADLRLMGGHMLCPLPFYQLDQPISPQCFHHGQLTPLTQATSSSPAPSSGSDSLGDLDDLDDI
jgi:hypothetical protein